MAGNISVSSLNAFGTQTGPIPLSELDSNNNIFRGTVNNLNSYSNYYLDSGSVNSYIVTTTANQSVTLTAGLTLFVLPQNTNTGPSTMDIDDLGVYPIVYNYNAPLTAGQIAQNEIMQLCFDGASWQLLSAINGDQSFSSVNVTGSTIPANGMYLPSANTVGISTNSTLRATVNSSGQFFVGSTSLPSDITSNQISINAGLFRSASMSTASTASGTAVTIFSLPNSGNGVWLIQASLYASADAPTSISQLPSPNFPDLIMVDGGRGQLNAACAELEKLGLGKIPVIGLAKEFEEIYLPEKSLPLRLGLDHPAVKLLQRLRDECHRVANSYNAQLRLKKISESVLDDFPGIGEQRKKALLKKFGSVQRLKMATLEQLAEVPGFGGKAAAELKKFLAARSITSGD
jgi:hypothetical protein